MLEEIRERKIKEKELTEDRLDEEKIEEEFPNTFKEVDKIRREFEEYTLKVKEKYPGEIGTFEKAAEEVGLKGILVASEKKEKEIKVFSLKFLLVPEKFLFYFRRLRDLDQDLAEKGLKYLFEWSGEFFKGEPLKILKEMFRKTEEFSKLRKEERPRMDELKEIDELRGKLVKSQFVEKIKKEAAGEEKKIIQEISDYETFLDLLKGDIIKILAVPEPPRLEKEKEKRRLLKDYPDLEEKIIEEIVKKFEEKLRKEYFEKRKKEDLETGFAA